MKKVIGDILDLQGVLAAQLLSLRGDTLLRMDNDRKSGPSFPQGGLNTTLFSGFSEVDLFFREVRLYVRTGPWGILMVLMEHSAPAALVRLNSDALASLLSDGRCGHRRGRRFFRRRR